MLTAHLWFHRIREIQQNFNEGPRNTMRLSSPDPADIRDARN